MMTLKEEFHQFTFFMMKKNMFVMLLRWKEYRDETCFLFVLSSHVFVFFCLCGLTCL